MTSIALVSVQWVRGSPVVVDNSFVERLVHVCQAMMKLQMPAANAIGQPSEQCGFHVTALGLHNAARTSLYSVEETRLTRLDVELATPAAKSALNVRRVINDWASIHGLEVVAPHGGFKLQATPSFTRLSPPWAARHLLAFDGRRLCDLGQSSMFAPWLAATLSRCSPSQQHSPDVACSYAGVLCATQTTIVGVSGRHCSVLGWVQSSRDDDLERLRTIAALNAMRCRHKPERPQPPPSRLAKAGVTRV